MRDDYRLLSAMLLEISTVQTIIYELSYFSRCFNDHRMNFLAIHCTDNFAISFIYNFSDFVIKQSLYSRSLKMQAHAPYKWSGEGG